ncbi:hypothetical protein PTTG_08601 [Puccinia triticina 1-1 BBBD Race 1]|uniref:CxC1 domain-containing protein n=1 Tax=Puccinia triticina (isolate 1-1 / race 1 (BBBD)) TaxID=630390 RepID=A0A180GMB6_PUCT1|nr:hypothetical protein PTTG_08601 [Puccinia triticina 1-1 BBBD Race 1]
MPRYSDKNLYKFHRGSRLPASETRAQRKNRLAHQHQDQLEFSSQPRQAQSTVVRDPQDEITLNPPETPRYNNENEWEDTDEPMSPEDSATLAQIRAYNRSKIHKNRQRNWKDIMPQCFQAYIYLKRKTENWTLPCSFDDYSKHLCNCSVENQHSREIDLVDLMSQKRTRITFCSCTPDTIHLLGHGYLSSTPLFPQTAFSIRLLNFYDILWNICNSHVTPFTEVIRRWNESRSIRLCCKNSAKPRDLRRNLSGAVDAYRKMKAMQRELVHTVTSVTKQDRLAQQSCPACFGRAAVVTNPCQSEDNNKVFICMDGNFQHCHHEQAEKTHLPLEVPQVFISPEEIKACDKQILEAEVAQKKTKRGKDRCTEQHKAADDRRNASTWKGCDDTGLFGCCCRHDSVLYFCNIHKAGEGRGLPMSIIKQIFTDVDPQINIGLLYDIGCTLRKFFTSRKLLTEYSSRIQYATAVFHSYVHDWKCQIEYNPRYNEGWGLSDGEGMERLWSSLSPLIGPQRYGARSRRFNALDHRSHFHNILGIEKLVLTLKRKLVHALRNRKYFQSVLDRLLVQLNPHATGQLFNEDFFQAQWQSQRDYELKQNKDECLKKEEQAQFYERGEALKMLLTNFLESLANPSPDSNPTHALNILEQIQNLQKEQDEQAKKLGSYFSVVTPRNLEQERRLGLLWSAKTALFKAAVELQGEMQPLQDCKARGERLGTILKEKICDALNRRKKGVIKVLNLFCNRRTDYLKNHAPNQLNLPENKPIDYRQFSKLTLDDPFWNDGYMCLSKEPWALDSLVRTGIHATLGIDRAKEEIDQLIIEIRRCLTWGVFHRDQLKSCIDQCVLGPMESDLTTAMEKLLGSAGSSAKVLVSEELDAKLTHHKKLLLGWNDTIKGMVALSLIDQNLLPPQWLALMEFLQSISNRNDAPVELDLLMEEEVLNNQESDGESAGVDDLEEIFAKNNERTTRDQQGPFIPL